jgi:FAD/FMN-containing dehydrogenase
MRKYGMTVDSLLSVDVVTADGTLLTASETDNCDLSSGGYAAVAATSAWRPPSSFDWIPSVRW